MARTMLQVRMDALRVHLKKAQDPLSWKKELQLQNFNVDDELWNSAVEEVRAAAGSQCTDLEELSNDLRSDKVSEDEAWSRFEAIRVNSDEIFRECLDLLGGLALRDQMTDPWICHFADELLKEFKSVGLRSSFSIPAADEATFSTLRRVVKVGFPEWHLWTLPLVAYEYAYVLIEEKEVGPRRLVTDVSERWTSRSTSDDLRDAERRAAEMRARVLVADAMATYTSGPAYAAAAIVMRLNPLVGEEAGRPSDDQRVAMLRVVLEEMNQDAGFDPYGALISNLIEYWERSFQAAVGQSRESPPTSPIDAAEFVRHFRHRFGTGGNQRYQAESWSSVVRPQADAWLAALRSLSRPAQLPVNDDAPLRRFTDVLNAAWLCRLDATKDYEPHEAERARSAVDKIEEAAKALFRKLIDDREEKRRSRLGRESKPAARPNYR